VLNKASIYGRFFMSIAINYQWKSDAFFAI
jgi:hypothetical protein